MLKKNGRRWCALLLAALLLLGDIPPALAAEGDTVHVSSEEELLRVVKQCSLDSWSRGKTVVLTADLDLKGESVTPFPIFCGIFDGQGHTISGLRVAESGSSMGLFRIVQEGAVIRDLTVAGTVAPSGSACQVGGIVGVNHGAVQNCTFRGIVQGAEQVGGIVGMNRETGEVSGCAAEGQIMGSTATGGIAGQNEGSLLKCSNSAEVNTSSPDTSTPPEDLDGALEQLGTGEITDSGEGLLSGHSDTGGVVGLSRGVVQSCVNNGTVGYPHVGYNVGGVAGRQSGYLSGCVNNAAVYGRKDVGGIVGQAEPDITILSGEQRLEQLREELDRLQSLIGQSVASADAQGDKISDTLSRLGGYAGSARDNTNVLLDQTSAFVDGNIQQVNTLSAAATDALDRLSPALDSLTGASALIGDMCGDLESAVEALQNAGSITQEAADAARQALERLENAGGELSGAAETMGAAVRQLQDAVIHRDEDAARRALAELSAAMSRLSGGIAQASDALEALKDAVHTGIFDIAALRQLRGALAAIARSARQAAQSILGLSQNTEFNWSALTGGIAAAGTAMSGLHDAVRLLTDALASLRDAGNAAEDLSGPLAEVRTALLSALDVGTTIGSGLESAFAGMENAVDTLRRNGGVTFVTLGEDFHDASSGLYNAASGLTRELEDLHAGVDSARGDLTGNLQAINQQSGVVTELLLDVITGIQDGAGGGSVISDTSGEDVDSIRQGKIAQCVNNGSVDGDRNVGGVAGAMAVEYGLDPEDDVRRLSLGATYETRAVLQANISRGEVTGKKDCVGGTVGRMDLGAVTGCQSYGSVTSGSGSYVGGIAGWSESVIRGSYAKCVLSGQDDVGGIAGWATSLQDCRAIATIAEGRSRLGAIAGSADLEGGGITGNRFVDTGTAGVDGVSYAGMAEPVAFTALRGEEDVPGEFLTFTLKLLADGEVQARIPFQYGQSLGGIALPETPEREGYYGRWPEFDTTGLVSDVTVEAVYTPVAALVASAETEDGPSLALAEGQFTEDAALTVRATSQSSPTGEGEVWKLTLTGTDLPPDAQVPIRLLDRTGGGTVWQYVSGHWQRMDAEKNGQYLLLTMDGLSGVFCVAPAEGGQTALLFAVAAAALALVLLLLAAKLTKRRKKKKMDKQQQEVDLS